MTTENQSTIRNRIDKRAQEIVADHGLQIKNRRDGKTYNVPSLPAGIELKDNTMNIIEDLFEQAHRVAQESGDTSTKVGALLVYQPNWRVQARACNDLPVGVIDTPERRERPLKYKYVCHAEAKLITQAARTGIICEDALIVTTHHPCSDCAKLMIEAGIKEVYYDGNCMFVGDWNDDLAIAAAMLKEAGVKMEACLTITLD